jgi:hypothetical protein
MPSEQERQIAELVGRSWISKRSKRERELKLVFVYVEREPSGGHGRGSRYFDRDRRSSRGQTLPDALSPMWNSVGRAL